ncbi:MAG: iron ABC transporter permease, partial [Gammaproteobacteria bacterium]
MASITGHADGRPPFWSVRNLGYQSYRLRNRPELIIGSLCLAFLGFVVLVPLFQIIRDALTYQSYDLAYRPDAEVGAFTLFHLDRVFVQPISKALFIKPLINSLSMGAAVTVIGVSVGSTLAWIMVRTNVKFKGVFGAMLVIP